MATSKDGPYTYHYGDYVDTTLDELSDDIKKKKQNLLTKIDGIKQKQAEQTKKLGLFNSTKQFFTTRMQYNKLTEIIRAIGSRDYLGQKFLGKNLSKLHPVFQSENNTELLNLLVEIYDLNRHARTNSNYFPTSLSFMNEQIRFFTSNVLIKFFDQNVSHLILSYQEADQDNSLQKTPASKP